MTTHEKLRQLTLTSLFIALVVLFGMTPLGLIPVGTLNATILHIPVIIGVIALGLKRASFSASPLVWSAHCAPLASRCPPRRWS